MRLNNSDETEIRRPFYLGKLAQASLFRLRFDLPGSGLSHLSRKKSAGPQSMPYYIFMGGPPGSRPPSTRARLEETTHQTQKAKRGRQGIVSAGPDSQTFFFWRGPGNSIGAPTRGPISISRRLPFGSSGTSVAPDRFHAQRHYHVRRRRARGANAAYNR